MKQIMLLGAFREVAKQLEEMAKRFGCGASGTVHTSQGKEADIVFLVLGGDPTRPGALEWAAERPNLLNVAASRARRRLYVIGDRNRWGELSYFSSLASRLPCDRAR
jgi:superfamily I DNA and/or RNA helicase